MITIREMAEEFKDHLTYVEEAPDDPDENTKVVAHFECEGGCRRAEGNVDEIVALIEHCLFDHLAPREIRVVASSTYTTPYEMRLELGLDAQTEAEEKWRTRQPGYIAPQSGASQA